ncbi:MAG TPA: hypothetical protein VGK54_04055, partial [Chloroflexota bacterium]
MLLRYVVVSMSLIALAACGRQPDARADTSVSADSTRCYAGAGEVIVQSKETVKTESAAGGNPDAAQPRDGVKDSTPATRDTFTDSLGAKRDTVSDSTAARRETARDSTRAAKDSAKEPPIAVRVAPGRSKKDSLALVSAVRRGKSQVGWPVKGPAPERCSLLPNKRIVAFYGNPLSKKMGILGQIPPDQMLAKLDTIVGEWRKADPETPVQPALHYIAVVASGDAGKDGKWRTRMDSSMIEEVYGWAQKRNAILFLDIQAGQSTVQAELPPPHEIPRAAQRP